MTRRPSLRSRLAAQSLSRLALFLDYDGTLTPIVSRPERADLAPAARKTLRKLAKLLPVTIVSGRVLADLRRRVAVSGLNYVALHGLVYQGPGGAVRWLARPVKRSLVRQWMLALRFAAAGIRGAMVEDKRLSVALHDRRVRPADRARLRRRALRALAPWVERQAVALLRGKRVLEARPQGTWNKGTAVTRLLREPWARRRVPIYVGDDRTDFDAIRAIKKRRGLTVRVGGRRGAAGEDVWLRDPAAVQRFLDWLSDGVSRDAGAR